MTPQPKAPVFPDTSIDRRAWEQAKREFADRGEPADLHAVIDRANQLKEIALQERML